MNKNHHELEYNIKVRKMKVVDYLNSENKWELVDRNLIVFISMNQYDAVRKMIVYDMQKTLFIKSNSMRESEDKYRETIKQLSKAGFKLNCNKGKLYIRIEDANHRSK